MPRNTLKGLESDVMSSKPKTQKSSDDAAVILRHWREAVPNDRLAHLVKDATRALLRALQTRLGRHSVSIGHWTFLRILWESDGLTQRELSRQAGVMEPTTSTALNAMERLGYVVRRQRPDNRKKVHVFLTPKGRALKARLVPLAEAVNDVAVRGLAPADVAATRRSLLRMLENLAADEAGAAPAVGRPRAATARSKTVPRRGAAGT